MNRRAASDGRAAWRRRSGRHALGAVGVVGALCAFELISALGIVHRRDVPPPSELIGGLTDLIVDGTFWTALGDTLTQALTGLLISCLIAIPAGLLIGSKNAIWRALRPTIEFLRPVPSVALVPIVLLTYGSTATSAVILIVWVCTWPLLIQSIYGVREVDPIARQTVQVFRLDRWERIRFLYMPSAAPFLVTGLSLAIVGSLILAVTSELVLGSPGLGNEMRTAQNSADTVGLYSLVVVTGLLGLALNLALERTQAKALKWHGANRREGAP